MIVSLNGRLNPKKNTVLFTMKNRSEMRRQNCYTPLLEGFWVANVMFSRKDYTFICLGQETRDTSRCDYLPLTFVFFKHLRL